MDNLARMKLTNWPRFKILRTLPGPGVKIMKSYSMTLQEIIDTVGEWHDHEGINTERNKLLAIFCAFADLHYNSPNQDYPSGDLNALRVAVEAAFQLGRATGRSPNEALAA